LVVAHATTIPAYAPLDRLLDDIEAMGFTRETPYTEDYRREKYRRAAEMGWTIIT
jgi:hypothetical protein